MEEKSVTNELGLSATLNPFNIISLQYMLRTMLLAQNIPERAAISKLTRELSTTNKHNQEETENHFTFFFFFSFFPCNSGV